MTVFEKLKESPEAMARELAEAQMNGSLYAIESLEAEIYGEPCLFTQEQESYLKALFDLRRRALRMRLAYDVGENLESLQDEEE